MGYRATGEVSVADWAEVKKFCLAMRKDMDAKLSALEAKLQAEIDNTDADRLRVIKNQLMALASSVSEFWTSQDIQNTRLDRLEDVAANLELTTSEILEIWEARN